MCRVNSRPFFHSSIEIFEGGILELGNSYINSGCIIACKNHIRIGNGCAIARNVSIYDSDFHIIENSNGEIMNQSDGIVIEDYVWIGIGAILLKGIRIVSGAVIAAGSVVTKDVPSNCMVAGNPAHIIRKDIHWR